MQGQKRDAPVGPEDPPGEQAIIAGLGKRNLTERSRWLVPAASSGSKTVFTALAALYPTHNDIQYEVLDAMKELNARTNGACAAEFSAALQAEYGRLPADSPVMQSRFLLDLLCYTIRAPKGLQPLVQWIRGLVESKALQIADPLAQNILALADLALGASGDAAALKRAVEAWLAGKLMEGSELIAVCTDLRTPELWHPLQKVLHAEPDRDDWLALAMAYLDYAAALKRPPDPDLLARYRELAAMPFRE